MTAPSAEAGTRQRADQRLDRSTHAVHAGTGTLVRFMLRRDRVKLPAWIGGLGLFVVYIGAALPQLAPTEEDLAGAVPLFNQPVGRMFTGPAFGMDAPTFERFFSAGYVLYLFLLVALMNIQLLSRHTRAEEQSGRAELVRANLTGRHAALTAALVVAGIANTAAAAVVAALAIANGFDPAGSLLVGCTVGMVGMAFAGVGAVTVQLTEYSRAASGMAGAALAVAFVLRAVGDMRAVGGSTMSWASPLGWASQTAPYVHDRWWPLLLLGGLSALGIGVGFWLQSRRDLGASLLTARPGRAEASPVLSTPFGLAARLQRGSALGWGTAVVLLAVVDGAFAQALVDAAADMPPTVREMFGGQATMLDGYIAFLATFSGYLTAAYVVFAMQGVRTEEMRGRAEAVLATPTSRKTWLGSHLAFIALAVIAIMLLSGVGGGLAAAAVTGQWSLGVEATLAHLNLAPAVLLVLGVSASLFGWAPNLLAGAGWTLVALLVFVGNFAELLDLSPWVRDLSPLSHPAQLPVEEFALGPVTVLTVLALVGMAVGLLGLRRRQIGVT